MELYYGNCDSNAKMVNKIANATKVAINDFAEVNVKWKWEGESERQGQRQRQRERERRKLRSKHAYMQCENVAKIAMVEDAIHI